MLAQKAASTTNSPVVENGKVSSESGDKMTLEQLQQFAAAINTLGSHVDTMGAQLTEVDCEETPPASTDAVTVEEGTEESTDQSLNNAMVAFLLNKGDLQEAMIQFGSNQITRDSNNSIADANEAKKSLNDLINSWNKYEKQKGKAEKAGFWKKLGSYIGGALLCAVPGGEALGFSMIAMEAAQAITIKSGKGEKNSLMGWAEKGVGKGLQKAVNGVDKGFGGKGNVMSDKAADLAGSIIVTGAVLAATMLSGAGVVEAGVKAGAEAGAEAGAAAGREAALAALEEGASPAERELAAKAGGKAGAEAGAKAGAKIGKGLSVEEATEAAQRVGVEAGRGAGEAVNVETQSAVRRMLSKAGDLIEVISPSPRLAINLQNTLQMMQNTEFMNKLIECMPGKEELKKKWEQDMSYVMTGVVLISTLLSSSSFMTGSERALTGVGIANNAGRYYQVIRYANFGLAMGNLVPQGLEIHFNLQEAEAIKDSQYATATSHLAQSLMSMANEMAKEDQDFLSSILEGDNQGDLAAQFTQAAQAFAAAIAKGA